MNYYLAAFKNYANFSGRARRSEYWYFVLFNLIIALSLLAFGWVIAIRTSSFTSFSLFFLYMLATLIPTLAVVVRRLHDIGKSGWYYFISFIPLVGGIWLLVLLFTEGTIGDNEYGPDPKAVELY